MRIRFTKGEGDDRVEMVRPDGSTVSTRFPHKGPIPHDFVHYAVEIELGLTRGFWGLVAAGHHPEEIAVLAKAAGHASAKRASSPDPGFIEAIQAERIVEAFEADHWSGGTGDPAGVAYMADAGCSQSLVPAADLNDRLVCLIRARIADFAGRWSGLAVGQSIEVDWPAA